MSKERDILKSLLLKEELEVLEQLKSKLLTEDQFTDEVSKVLSNAIKRSQKTNSQLEHSLRIPIKNGVIRAFTESKQTIIDALLPIMGQLIRKTVTNSIKQFVSDINRTLELGFSAKALKWRWQALRSDKSFAEIVFQKTIRYQVQDIFLINKSNGLLIEYAGSDDLLKDSNAISGMLTAIQSFIGDSFETEDANLQSAQISNQDFIVATGPKVYLAAVVKGNPTERLKQKFQEVIENIHADYSEVLLQEETYQNNLELNDFLRSKLVTKSISDKPSERKIMPWILGFILLTSALGYWIYHREHTFNIIKNKTLQIEGFYLQKIERGNGGFIVYGLLDPLADTSVFKDEKVTFITKPYISIDTEIVNKRIKNTFLDFPTVQTFFKDGILELRGTVTKDEYQTLLGMMFGINGVSKTTNHLELLVQEKGFSYIYEEINNRYISIPDMKDKNAIAKQLSSVIKNLHLLSEKQVKIVLNIEGTSDCSGTLSNDYSLRRGQIVKDILLEELTLENAKLNISTKQCKKQVKIKNLSLLGVNLKLKKQ